MQYAYQKLMAENNLTLAELPEDAKLGIEAIKNIEKAVNMAEKKGKKVSPQTMAKIKANDKWVVREILDYIDDEDVNEEEMPYEDDEIIEEIEEDDANGSNNPQKQLGFKIESELEKMFLTNEKEFELSEIKRVAPTTYGVIFDGFDNDGDNGVETNKFRLIETDEEIFTLTKK
jgi:DNA integrity scanning protein DisA with diadenylate cyclase activity